MFFNRGVSPPVLKNLKKMDKIRLYIKEAYNELVHKVTWPTWASLQSNTVLVIVASIIFALIILVMDIISKTGTNYIYGTQ